MKMMPTYLMNELRICRQFYAVKLRKDEIYEEENIMYGISIDDGIINNHIGKTLAAE